MTRRPGDTRAKPCPRCGQSTTATIFLRLNPKQGAGPTLDGRTRNYCDPCGQDVFDLLASVLARNGKVTL